MCHINQRLYFDIHKNQDKLTIFGKNERRV